MAKKIRRSNVKDGVLLPLGNGFSLVKGDHPNKVDDVDIGPNNKNGLSVNNGEILQQKGNTLRVFSAEPMLGGISPVQLLYGGMAPDKVFAMQEQYKNIHKINDDGSKYVMGGDKENIPNTTYNKLSKNWKSLVNIVASKIGVSKNEIEKYFNEGRLNPAISAYYNVNGRVRENDSPTKEASEKLGDNINKSIYGNVISNGQITQSGKPNLKYAIPYLEDKEIVVDGVGRLTTNALDSLAKYAKISNISLQEALGLYGQETIGGAVPYGNVEKIKKTDSVEKQKEIKERNRALFNLNYSREYGWIPAEYIVRDFEYNRLGHEVDRTIPPLQHAFDYFKKGKYNTGDSSHTKDVLNKGSQMLNDSDVKKWISESEYTKDVKVKKQFGGQTNINSLGERPNAKYKKEMKNKRNKALTGITISPYKDRFGNNIDLLNGTIYKDNSNINLLTGKVSHKIANPDNIKLLSGNVSKNIVNPVGNLTKSNGLSTTAMSAVGAGINTLGSLIGAGIQQYAINNLKAPQRQYTLLNPVKLKTKININSQIARMRETQAQIADAARRTSGSSRTAYQKILASHNRLLDSAMDLYGRKENIETELINRDRLNQQRVEQANATNVMNTINYNNEAATEMKNRKQIATSNNWTNALNTTAGAWAGLNGFVDRANALRVKAGELYTQAIANPTAARLLYGDINFVTDADKRKAFNTIYDFLNNNRFA